MKMKQVLKLKRKEKRNLINLIKSMNELLNIDNTIKIKNTIKKLELDHEHNGNLEFDYGKNFIRIYSMSGEWQVHKTYDDVYFDIIYTENGVGEFFRIDSNCKTPLEYIPNIVETRIMKGLKYLSDNSKEFIKKINLIVDEDKRNIALKEFLPRRYVKI